MLAKAERPEHKVTYHFHTLDEEEGIFPYRWGGKRRLNFIFRVINAPRVSEHNPYRVERDVVKMVE